jgi:hypothetical protein
VVRVAARVAERVSRLRSVAEALSSGGLSLLRPRPTEEEWRDLGGLQDLDADLCKAGWTDADGLALVALLRAAPPPRSALWLDFSYAKPTLADLLLYAGFIGYVSPRLDKNVPAPLVAGMLEGGREVRLVWQAGGTGPLGGVAQGRLDAREADRQAAALARAVGIPNDELPILFACDFAPTTAQRRTVEGYFLAAHGTTERPGADGYGADYVLDWLNLAGVPARWQTEAWSARRVSAHAAMLQKPGAPYYGNPGGRAVDENVRLPARPWPSWRKRPPTRPTGPVVGAAWRRA